MRIPRQLRILGLVLASAVLAAAAPAPAPLGYLADGAFDVVSVIPPAPQEGDARYNSDRAIFLATRKLVGTPRYALATSDAKAGAADLIGDFSCAVGVTLTPEDAPRTAALVRRASHDTGAQTNRAKNFYRRVRPFQIDPGEVCQDKVTLARSFDYPSGHTTAGWTWALILAELVPSRAAEILARGRAYGESRFICGAHNQSAVEAGRLSATATMTVIRTTSAYQSDAAAAKREMRALRADPSTPRPAGCAAERALIAEPLP